MEEQTSSNENLEKQVPAQQINSNAIQDVVLVNNRSSKLIMGSLFFIVVISFGVFFWLYSHKNVVETKLIIPESNLVNNKIVNNTIDNIAIVRSPAGTLIPFMGKYDIYIKTRSSFSGIVPIQRDGEVNKEIESDNNCYWNLDGDYVYDNDIAVCKIKELNLTDYQKPQIREVAAYLINTYIIDSGRQGLSLFKITTADCSNCYTVEFYDPELITYKVYIKPEGFIDQTGMEIKNVTNCIDTDDKYEDKDIFIKGIVSYIDQNGVEQEMYDKCHYSKLEEMYCEQMLEDETKMVFRSRFEECPAKCQDNRCVKEDFASVGDIGLDNIFLLFRDADYKNGAEVYISNNGIVNYIINKSIYDEDREAGTIFIDELMFNKLSTLIVDKKVWSFDTEYPNNNVSENMEGGGYNFQVNFSEGSKDYFKEISSDPKQKYTIDDEGVVQISCFDSCPKEIFEIITEIKKLVK